MSDRPVLDLGMQDLRRAKLEAYQNRLEHRCGRGQDHWQQFVQRPDATWRDFASIVLERRGRPWWPEMDEPPTGTPVNCWVENNRWIARCECGGQETVEPGFAQFFCLSCMNALTGGRPRPLNVPADWRGIDSCLAARPNPLNRCQAAVMDQTTLRWTPVETLADLEAENAAQGLPPRRPG